MHSNPHQSSNPHGPSPLARGNPGQSGTPARPGQPIQGSAGPNPANGGAPPIGRPVQQPSYEPAPAPPPETSKVLLGVCVVGVLLAAAGLARSFLMKPETADAAPAVHTPSPWEEQQRIMREALDMAREAQQMQREHQQMMQRAIAESDGGDSPE